ADVVSKGALFLITVVAAHRLSAEAFGLFALAATLGWMLAVAADAGIQLHVARTVAARPAAPWSTLRRWLRVRLSTSALAILGTTAILVAAGTTPSTAVPLLLLTATYAASGMAEFVHYLYRGLSRTDLESSITLWQRIATLASGLIAL